jgi:hypothetical protein
VLPQELAQEAIEEIGGDGFLVQGHIKPSYVHAITDELVPALQKRELTRAEYATARSAKPCTPSRRGCRS